MRQRVVEPVETTVSPTFGQTFDERTMIDDHGATDRPASVPAEDAELREREPSKV